MGIQDKRESKDKENGLPEYFLQILPGSILIFISPKFIDRKTGNKTDIARNQWQDAGREKGQNSRPKGNEKRCLFHFSLLYFST